MVREKRLDKNVTDDTGWGDLLYGRRQGTRPQVAIAS